jgi:hypothetical protein
MRPLLLSKSDPHRPKLARRLKAEFIDTPRPQDGLPEGSHPFLDAVHPTMATKLGYGWSIKGGRKIVATTKKRVNAVIRNPQRAKPQIRHFQRQSTQRPWRTLRPAPKLSEPGFHGILDKALLRDRGHQISRPPRASGCGIFPLFAQP